MTTKTQSPDRETLTLCALVGIATFPVVGNAFAWLVGMPRRTSQELILILFASLLAYSWYRFHTNRIMVPGTIKRHLSYGFLISTGLVGGLCAAAVFRGAWPPMTALWSAIAIPLWLTLSITSLFGEGRFHRPTMNFGKTSPVFNRFICGLLLALTLIAYFRGPTFGEVEMAFGGSTTVAGTIAAMLGGLALSVLSGWYRVIGLLMAIYLCFVATSRTGILLFVVLFVAILIASWLDVRNAGEIRRKIIGDCTLLLICTIVVVFPAQFSLYYPYFSSRPGEAGARLLGSDGKLTEWENFELRYDRIERLLGEPGLENVAHNGFLGRLESADNRWEILLRTINVVAANPWGYWPQSFEDVAEVQCGNPRLCKYPHNIVLEVGFHFGWMPMGLVAIGLLALGIRTVNTLNHSAIAVRVISVALLSHLVFAQFSGDLVDNLVVVALGIFWIILVGSENIDNCKRKSTRTNEMV